MRSLNFHHSKLFLKLKQIFNLIKTMINVQMYSLQEIAFNYYKVSVINLFSVLITRKSRKRALIIKNYFKKFSDRKSNYVIYKEFEKCQI